MDRNTIDTLIEWADKYNDPQYFQEDPIIFPKHFAGMYKDGAAVLADLPALPASPLKQAVYAQ